MNILVQEVSPQQTRLTAWQRHRVMQALESSDLLHVNGQTMLVVPLDDSVLEYFAVWGADTVDDEEGGDLEECCETKALDWRPPKLQVTIE